MKVMFYKQRKNRLLGGVCSGLADKFGWDLALTRVFTALLMYATVFGIVLYILLTIFLPYKEDLDRDSSSEPRRRKDAEVVDADDDWFW